MSTPEEQLTHLAQELRQRLARAGLTPEVDPDLPAAEQLAHLQHLLLAEVARCREQAEANRRTEEALQRSRTRLGEAEKLSHTGAWEWDLTTGQWTFSDEWLTIHGVSRHTLTPDELLIIAHPDDRTVIQQAFADVRHGVKPYDLVHRIIRQDTGEVRVVRARGQFVCGADGAVVRVYGFAQDITEQKRTENELRRSEERIRTILESTTDGYLAIDRDWRYTYINEQGARIIGRRREEVLGQRLWESLPAVLERTLGVPFLQVMERGQPAHVEAYYPVPLHRWLDVHVYPTEEGLAVYFRDITRQRRVEEEINRLSEQRQLALDAAHLGWWHYDPVTKIATYDQRYREIFDVTGSQRPNAEILTRLHPDDLPGVWAKVEAALNPVDPQPYAAEYRIMLPGGVTRWVEAHGLATFEGEGAARHAVSLVGTVADITDRKQADDEREHLLVEVQRRAAELAATLESIADGITLYDQDGILWYMNAAAERMLGYTPAERALPLKERIRLLHITRAEGTPVPFEATPAYLAMQGETVRSEVLVFARPGHTLWLSFSAAPITLSDGTRVGSVVSFTDITPLHQAQQELQQFAATLEQRVHERTAALEAANKELEAFSYSVSHDLRAPLRSLDGFSKILLDKYTGQLDATGQNYLQRVRNAAIRMGRLIDDMLSLSRIGRVEMRREPVPLSELAAAVLAELRQRDPDRRVQVEIQPGLEVTGDAGLLRIALENLLGNAWKFTSKTPEARIEVGSRRQDQTRVYFVRDNGAGFDMSYAGKLFTPFQRLHTEEEFPGTGIGLAIVKRIITRHDGQIWAEGAAGNGATIYFTVGDVRP